jgi:hypothetical protein
VLQNSLKMYDKFGHVLRLETVANDVSFFKHHRRVEHRDGTWEMKVAPVRKSIYSLPALADLMGAANHRYLEFLSTLDDASPGLKPLERVTTPVRQGTPFWHYGKDFETVKRQFSRFLFREELIGAYYGGELVGFAMLANARQYGVLGQIISKIKHRDKAINNALIAKVIEKCETKQLPYLVYAYWNENSLSDFKRHCGFECIKLPRYFVPLTFRGTLALKLGIHRDWKEIIPGRDGITSESVTAFQDYLVTEERHRGLTQIRNLIGAYNAKPRSVTASFEGTAPRKSRTARFNFGWCRLGI